MTVRKNSFEGGTSGTTVTTANSATGGDALTDVGIASGQTLVFDSTHTAHGSMAAKVVTTSSTSYVSFGLGSTVPKFAARGYFYVTSGNGARLLQIRRTGGYCLTLQIASTGQLQALDSSGGGAWISSSAFPLNQWVRLEAFVDTTTSTATFASYAADSTTAIDTQTIGSWSYGSNPIGVRFGNVASAAATMWVDDVAQDDAADGLIGPYTPPATPYTHYRYNGTAWVAQDVTLL